MVRIFHSDRFVPELPKGHRFPIEKYRLIREQLLYEGTVLPQHLEEAEMVSEADILAVHSADWWTAVRELRVEPRMMRRVGFPQSEELVVRSRRSVQGTVKAARWALENGIGLNIAGGTHHAFANHGEGFCLLNDLAIAARHLQRHWGLEHVLIVDLDVHQGNGSAEIFANDPSIFTFSMHGRDNYPLKKMTSDLDIGLPSGTGDELYLATLRSSLEVIWEKFQPDLVLYQSGVDVLAEDRLGRLALTRAGCRERDKIVFSFFGEKLIPIAVSMGGGYGQRLVDTVEAHANTFREAVRLFG